MANIGVDVDGVLTNLEKFQLENGKKFFGENKVVNENAYDVKDIFDCSSSEREKFWLKYIWKYSIEEEITPYASDALNKLKDEGNKIYIITGRVHTTKTGIKGKLFRKMLEDWLEKNKIPYEQIVYCDEKNSADDKYEACEHLNIDIMLEDKVENIKALKKISKIICFNSKYNNDYIDQDIYRVNDFNEAYNIISKLNFNSNHFEVLSGLERNNLSVSEQIKYYENLRKYYMELPYDYDKISKLERNYKLAFNIGMPIFKMIYKPIVLNKELIPEGNGYIFVSNHLGSFDQFPIMTAIGNRPIHFMAASTLYNLKRGILYRNTGSIFVDREDSDSKKAATEMMTQILINGGNIFIFPEGTRNRSEKYMLEFKKGAVSIAQSTGAPIIPFAVNNNYSIKDRNLIVRAGNPFYVNAGDNLEEKNNELRDIIASMIWENMELEQQIDNEKNKIYKK